MPYAMNPFNGNLQIVSKVKVKSVLKDTWNNDVSLGGGGAVKAIEFDQDVFNFGVGIQQGLKTRIKVPYDYSGGQLSAIVTVYSEATANNFLFKTVATLINATSALNSVVNQRISTNTEMANAAPQYKKQKFVCDLTDGLSKINGVAVLADDIIDIWLYRDTATSDEITDMRVLPNIEIVKA